MKVTLFSILFFLFCFTYVSAETIDVNNLLVKISTYPHQSFNRTVTFSSASGGDFEASIEGIPQGVTLAQRSFHLEDGQSTSAIVLFDTSLLQPGVYVGSLLLRGATTQVAVPIILEIETEDVFFDANVDIPPQYTEVAPGEKVVAQVKIFDLVSGGTTEGLGPTNVLLQYAIVDTRGKQISSESETVSVDATAQITQALGFPDSMPPGDYVFYVTATYQSSLGSSSHLFKITSPPNRFSFLTSQTYIIIGAFTIFFFGMIGFFIYLLKDRDSLIVELHRLNHTDFRRQKSFIQAQARVLVHTKGHSVAPLVKRELARVKQRHDARIIQLRALKQKGDVQAMKRQLAQWKAEYSSAKGLSTLHGLSPQEMKRTLAQWKAEYKH